MIKLLKNILNNPNSLEEIDDNKNLELLCGLMIEAAYTDGEIDQSELHKIKFSLINTFDENSENVDKVLEKALDTKFKTKFIFKKVREIERTVAGKIKFIRRDL